MYHMQYQPHVIRDAPSCNPHLVRQAVQAPPERQVSDCGEVAQPTITQLLITQGTLPQGVQLQPGQTLQACGSRFVFCIGC